jgi:hypothetical protein
VLKAPVRLVLHRLPCSNKTVRNAPKHEFWVQCDEDINYNTRTSTSAAQRSIPGATYTTRRTSTPGLGAITYTWANYSGPCEGIELHHAIEERRSTRIAVGPTGGPTFATLGGNGTRGTVARRPSWPPPGAASPI